MANPAILGRDPTWTADVEPFWTSKVDLINSVPLGRSTAEVWDAVPAAAEPHDRRPVSDFCFQAC